MESLLGRYDGFDEQNAPLPQLYSIRIPLEYLTLVCQLNVNR